LLCTKSQEFLDFDILQAREAQFDNKDEFAHLKELQLNFLGLGLLQL
jgi:hypothetical protein